MLPTAQEMLAIEIAENFIAGAPKSFFKSVFSKRFKFNDYEVPTEKTLAAFWKKFGLRNGVHNISFSEEQKIDCISQWFNALYPFEVNIATEYKKEKDEFTNRARRFYEQNPHMHVNWDFPNPEKLLLQVTERFGCYDAPKLYKQEIDDIELFDFGIRYIRERLVEFGYEIDIYQEPPLVPQFVLKKSSKVYFLYCKVERVPRSSQDLFTNQEIDGYARYCLKQGSELLLAGVVFSNGQDESKPLFKEDKVKVDFTGFIDMFN